MQDVDGEDQNMEDVHNSRGEDQNMEDVHNSPVHDHNVEEQLHHSSHDATANEPGDEIQTTHVREEPNQKTTDPTTPVTPLTRGPIFDSTAGPSSPPGTRGRLSPPPFTPLKSPVKSNGSGIGFASHAATHNAFTATASSNSPPFSERNKSADEVCGLNSSQSLYHNDNRLT